MVLIKRSAEHELTSDRKTKAVFLRELAASLKLLSFVSACGSSQVLDASEGGIIGSPNYPDNYGNYHDCYWTIVSDAGTTIRLDFLDFITEDCCDYLTVGSDS